MQPDFSVREQEVYLDNAATTIIDEEVVAAMIPYLGERYGNPETPYHLGREAQEAVEEARACVAELLGCLSDDVYFTSGGTESNNWAIKGYQRDKAHVLIGAVEHASVMVAALTGLRGVVKVGTVPVDDTGAVKVGKIEQALKKGKVGLVSVQHSNNEVGTLQPVKEIAALCKEHGAHFHCDACQSYGKVPIDVDDDGYDMVSLSAHKIHGPMGVGALYIRPDTPMEPLFHGGGHERGMRAGTLAVAQVVGLGTAARLAHEAMKQHMPRLSKMVGGLAHELGVKCGATRNGSESDTLPNVLNVSLPDVDATLLVGILNKDGICISTGSACQSRKGISPVLKSMGKDRKACESAVRISLSRYTTSEHLIYFVARLQAALRELPKRETM